jgi:Spy/CpxP family protein refolding chaperone
MAALWFIFGLLSALVIGIISLTWVYFHLKRNQNKGTNIKGYLDLIPDLTEDQRTVVRKIRSTFLPKIQQIRENLLRERAELAALLFAESPDREKIYGIARQISAHQSALENEVIEHILEEKEILTPSQQRKFREIILDQFSSGGLGVHDATNVRQMAKNK